ncbi:MAG: twin-arginine translocase TatA/TatE family subunit [Acidimicrobiia bacterium]|nr:MAG: twin-arginine translocase TatA/TatE family subunit [Acidimicrobiia bacterium]
MLRNIGTPELLVILAVVLLLFGAKRLPKLAKSVGESLREFRESIDEGAADEEEPKDDTATESGEAAT